MKKAIGIVAMALVLGRMAEAQYMVAQHFGTNDPLTEGWTLVGGSSEGPIIDGGTAAWNVNDSSTAFRLIYPTNNLTLSPLQSNLFNNSGWHLSWKVSLVTTIIEPANLGAIVDLGLQDIIPGAPRYRVFLGRNANDFLIRVRDNAGDGGDHNFTLPGLASGFHTFDVVGDPNSANARLYVDNSLIPLLIWDGEADTEKRLMWGSNEESTVAESHWAYIYLEVPEPSVLGLASLAAVGLAIARSRKR